MKGLNCPQEEVAHPSGQKDIGKTLLHIFVIHHKKSCTDCDVMAGMALGSSVSALERLNV
jgi:hypothetical protein